MDQKAYLLALYRTLPFTFQRFQILENWCKGEWEKVYKAKKRDVSGIGLDPKFLSRWGDVSSGQPEVELKQVNDVDAKILVYGEPGYPAPLLTLYSPPVVLFCRGEIQGTDFPALGVVGSRKITTYGERVAQSLLTPLTQKGCPIVSGFAYGVDILAHKIAIENGARTIAVLGSGIDYIYPAAHKSFGEKILKDGSGVFLSEYLPKTKALPQNFPVRNRIISGLSKGVLVLQAGMRSGTLITARVALEQGREVMAVPGDIFEPQSEGVHSILQKGEAALVQSSQDIIDIMGFNTSLQTRFPLPQNLTKEEQEILSCFAKQNVWNIDELARVLQRPSSSTFSTITLLEMKGLLTDIGQHRFGLCKGE